MTPGGGVPRAAAAGLGSSLGLARSSLAGLAAAALLAGLAVSAGLLLSAWVGRGVTLALGVWALATNARIKLNNTVVIVFVFMGPFFGVKNSDFFSRSTQIDWRECGLQDLSGKELREAGNGQ